MRNCSEKLQLKKSRNASTSTFCWRRFFIFPLVNSPTMGMFYLCVHYFFQVDWCKSKNVAPHVLHLPIRLVWPGSRKVDRQMLSALGISRLKLNPHFKTHAWHIHTIAMVFQFQLFLRWGLGHGFQDKLKLNDSLLSLAPALLSQSSLTPPHCYRDLRRWAMNPNEPCFLCLFG